MSNEGLGEGICITTLTKETKLLYLKLDFECLHNVLEYEVLILGLNALKNLKDKRIYVYGASNIFINQVKRVYDPSGFQKSQTLTISKAHENYTIVKCSSC